MVVRDNPVHDEKSGHTKKTRAMNFVILKSRKYLDRIHKNSRHLPGIKCVCDDARIVLGMKGYRDSHEIIFTPAITEFGGRFWNISIFPDQISWKVIIPNICLHQGFVEIQENRKIFFNECYLQLNMVNSNQVRLETIQRKEKTRMDHWKEWFRACIVP